MERLSLAQIASWCGAQTAPEGDVGRISIDSRDVDADTLFAMLRDMYDAIT